MLFSQDRYEVLSEDTENTERGAWHTASVATAAAPTTTSFSIIGTHQYKWDIDTRTQKMVKN